MEEDGQKKKRLPHCESKGAKQQIGRRGRGRSASNSRYIFSRKYKAKDDNNDREEKDKVQQIGRCGRGGSAPHSTYIGALRPYDPRIF